MKIITFRRFIFNDGCAELASERTGQVASFKITELQNARTHLWKAHHIGAFNGEKKSEAQVGIRLF
jgi:hypothetical protein